jgi:hypothetical protein
MGNAGLVHVFLTRNKRAEFLPELLFHPEDRGDMFFQNHGRLSADYTVIYHRRYVVYVPALL